MANVDLVFAVTPRTFPFRIPPGADQQTTAIPRARLTYQLKSEALAVKAALDTTSITINCTLPVNFAYTFEYATMDIQIAGSADDADNFSDNGRIIVSFADGLGLRQNEFTSLGLINTLLNVGSTKIWGPVNPYCCPIFNQDGLSPTISLLVNDVDADTTGAGTLSCVVTVMQYDLDQVFNYPLNFPLPVALR